MNSKIALISDVHWGAKKGAAFMVNSMEKYFIEELIPYLTKNKIKKLFVLGDFFDTRTSVDVRVNNVVFTVLKELEKKKIEVTMLLGNHDIFFNSSTNVHSLKYFDLFSNIKVIDRITEMEIYGKKCIFFPWQTDNLFMSVDYSNIDVAFGHFAITGCNLNKSQVHEGGTPQSFFHTNFPLTFTGHFHQPGSYKQGNSEIVYLGSPYHINRSDSNGDRGIIVLDMNDLSYTRVNSENTVKYIAITYGMDLTKVKIPGNIIDVHVNITSSYSSPDLNNYVSLIENCPEGSPISVRVIPHYEVVQGEDYELSDDEIEKVKSIPEMVKSKLSNMDLSESIKGKVAIYINSLIDTVEQTKV